MHLNSPYLQSDKRDCCAHTATIKVPDRLYPKEHNHGEGQVAPIRLQSRHRAGCTRSATIKAQDRLYPKYHNQGEGQIAPVRLQSRRRIGCTPKTTIKAKAGLRPLGCDQGTGQVAPFRLWSRHRAGCAYRIALSMDIKFMLYLTTFHLKFNIVSEIAQSKVSVNEFMHRRIWWLLRNLREFLYNSSISRSC
jgi:hypothetical protein